MAVTRPVFVRVVLARKWRAVSCGLLRAAAIAGLREPGLTFDAIRLQLCAAATRDLGSIDCRDWRLPPLPDLPRRKLALREQGWKGVARLCLAIAVGLAVFRIVQLTLNQNA